ncbi:MAG: hypothetical protein HY042_01180 [Spirochaetia bacterium]|nr:hypothetical protein [Spirochaetia bacterium]
MSRRGWIVFLAALAFAYLTLDRLVFDEALWRIPNETAWETDPHYNFEYSFRHVPPKRSGVRRIVIVGSSIAGYSVLPELLQRELAAQGNGGEAPEILPLSHQGMNGFNLLTYAERLKALQPDLIVFPTNMVDYRVERPIMLGLLADIVQQDSVVRAAALEKLTREMALSPEVRTLGPREAMRYAAPVLTLAEKSSFLAAWLSPALRFRDIAFTPISAFYAHRWGRDRSYTHTFVPGSSVTLSGWTAPRFSIPVTARLLLRGLEVESKGETGAVTLALRSSATDDCGNPNTAKPITFQLAHGWQRIDVRGFSEGSWVCGAVSPAFYSDELGTDLGVRLTATAGLEPGALVRRRELRYDDVLFSAYSDDEYRRSFARRILRFDRAGMEYLKALEIAKKVWSDHPFNDGLPAFQSLAVWKNVMSGAGIPVLIVESPENPVSRAWYGASPWAKSFSDFLSREPAGAPGGCITHKSAVNLLRMQDFYDYHHLSYFGAVKFTRWLAKEIPPDARCVQP